MTIPLDERLALLDELGVNVAYVTQHITKLRRHGRPVRVKTDVTLLMRAGRKIHRLDVAELAKFLPPDVRRHVLEASRIGVDPLVFWVRIHRMVDTFRRVAANLNYGAWSAGERPGAPGMEERPSS